MAKPNPSWPMATPAWMVTWLPTSAWVTVAFGPDIAVAADMHPVADHAAGGNGGAAPDRCLGSDHRSWLDD